MYLSKFGYVIRKEDLDKDTIESIKKDLTVVPLCDGKFGIQGQNNYKSFIETINKIYLPKMYGISRFGKPQKYLDNYNGIEWENPHHFNGALLDRQKEPSEKLIKSCKEDGGGILSLSTGFGKTFVCLYCIHKLATKCIVVVNKVPLMKQWVSEIKTFLPSVSVVQLQGNKYSEKDITNADIVITMLQSVSKINYSKTLFDQFGCAVFDECHNTSSKMFSKALFKLCSRYTIGLSATPKRSDGCECVYKWHLGDFVYKDSGNATRNGLKTIVNVVNLSSQSGQYKEFFTEGNAPRIQFTTMITHLTTEMQKRNELILYFVMCLAKDPLRKILVLSDRREHLKILFSLLEKNKSKKDENTFGLFLGGMKNEDLQKSRDSQIILATYSAFGEGVSEKDLNTLILTTPKKYLGENTKSGSKQESGKLEQVIGRIFRKDHMDCYPVIVDFCDDFSVYRSQSNQRNTFYRSKLNNKVIVKHKVSLDTPSFNVELQTSFCETEKNNVPKEDEKDEKICIIEDD